MNIDNLIDIEFDFDKLKNDCLIHDFLKMYSKKKSILTSCWGSDILERYLKNAMCFPSECENCVGMKKAAIRKFIQRHNYVRISELVHMPDPLVRQQLFEIIIGQVAYGINAIGAHGWGLIALTGDALESLKHLFDQPKGSTDQWWNLWNN